MKLNDKIVENALKDEGQEEVKGNHGWKDKDFELLMKSTGWQDGNAWCAFWVEKIWKQSFPSDHEKILSSLFSGNAAATFEAFFMAGMTSNEPIEGAIAIWQKVTYGMASFVGETQWKRGHAAIVINTEGDASEFTTLEGNSNSKGGREGIEVARQTRNTSEFGTVTGLQLLGFIHPKEIS